MAIGTIAAILGGSALLAGGSALSASSANKNAKAASADATATARENNALTREIYSKNEATLSPFVQTGTAAGALLNDFYGIQPQAAHAGALASFAPSGMSGPNYAGYVNSNPDLMAEFSRVSDQFGGDPAAFGEFHYNTYGQGEGRTVPVYGAATASPATGAPVSAPSSKSAFANYIANSDYAFQQQEGGNAVNSGYAGTGVVQSGAAMKALEKFRQNLQSGYRQQWAGGVANQQGIGAQAGSALAGVAANFGNTIAASNTAASDARANAALSQQNVFGNALGTAGGALLKGFG